MEKEKETELPEGKSNPIEIGKELSWRIIHSIWPVGCLLALTWVLLGLSSTYVNSITLLFFFVLMNDVIFPLHLWNKRSPFAPCGAISLFAYSGYAGGIGLTYILQKTFYDVK